MEATKNLVKAAEDLNKSLWELKYSLELSLLKCPDLATEMNTEDLFEDMLCYEYEEKYELADICKNELIQRTAIPF